jgi:hypothetical protein
LLTQLGDRVVELRAASGVDELLQRCRVLNSVIAAASTRLSWPDASAPIAVADPAAVVAAFTVSRDTDNFLATFVVDRPESSIC